MAELTPMMQQYMEIKNQYKDCILFYRLGDFYEMFYEDALTASKELEITLTGKSCGQEEKAPMCGVPHHAIEVYLGKLIQRGYRVAICEQTEEATAKKGIVKREVIRIVTPGTNLNTQSLEEGKNNFLMGVYYTKEQVGISVVDVTTGDYLVTEVEDDKKILDEIQKYLPSEIICNKALKQRSFIEKELRGQYQIQLNELEEEYFLQENCLTALFSHFSVSSSQELSLDNYSYGIIAAGAVMQYLVMTQKNNLEHLTKIQAYRHEKYMILDASTRRNLELTETLRDKQKRGSLLFVLDKTKTAMGARKLRSFLEQPLLSPEEIMFRQDAVAEFLENGILREEIREYLNAIYDIERIMSKISYQTAGPRDLLSFSASLKMLAPIALLLEECKSAALQQIRKELDPLEDLFLLINSAIEPEAPLSMKEGGVIREGYQEEVDALRHAKTEGKRWLMELEQREKEATGIKNLRIKYNRVFGYYLEVTNSYQHLVPEHWSRKQTMSNAERYATIELKELEDKILNAEERLFTLEYELFCELREKISKEVGRILTTAKAIANTDVFASFAVVADKNQYVRPSLNTEGRIFIEEGRHPVVEQMIPNGLFVSNHTTLDLMENRISILTGPNMAGKSTYMRQTALIVFLAQIGSFVPASKADIGIVDRIFTRIGASDDLASGKSTFMVEMTEVANILCNATKNSLLILDEIGRGTSTFDGLAIAFAVVEQISNTACLGAKALFATHYHELTELEGKIEGVKNYCIAVKEQGEDIIFLRKIMRGGADKSYGIQVAKLAGVPEPVLKRAREIVEELSNNDIVLRNSDSISKDASMKDKKIESFLPILKELKEKEVSNLTPFEALSYLYQMQQRLEKL